MRPVAARLAKDHACVKIDPRVTDRPDREHLDLAGAGVD